MPGGEATAAWSGVARAHAFCMGIGRTPPFIFRPVRWPGLPKRSRGNAERAINYPSSPGIGCKYTYIGTPRLRADSRRLLAIRIARTANNNEDHAPG